MEGTNQWYMGQGEEQEHVLKAARRRFSGIGGAYALGTIIILAVQTGAAFIVKTVKPEWLYNYDSAMAVSMLPMYLIGIPLLILLVTRMPGRAPERRPMKAGHFVLAVFMCFAIMYIANFAGIMITTVIGMLKGGVVQNTMQDLVTSMNPLTLFLYTVICAPVIEELVFRKLIVDRTVRYGQGVAAMVSGLMFGLFHGNLNQFVYAFGLGVFLAFLYAKTGNLKITIAIHMIINFFGSIVSMAVLNLLDFDRLLSLQNSGMQPEALMQYVSENMLGIIAYIGYVCLVLGVALTGAILLIVSTVKRRFALERAEVVIPRGKKFSTVILNLGMIVYCLIWIGMIIYQLFQ